MIAPTKANPTASRMVPAGERSMMCSLGRQETGDTATNVSVFGGIQLVNPAGYSSMYVPTHFAEHDLTKLHDAIERYSFATLVSGSGGELIASHLPLLVERTSGSKGTLLGHMARANPHWK